LQACFASKIPVFEVTEQLGESYLEKFKLSYQNSFSEFLYKEISNCFQSMFYFFYFIGTAYFSKLFEPFG